MFDATEDPLGLDLAQRARAHRDKYNSATQEYADSLASLLHDPSISVNARSNNARASYFGNMANPGWDKFFQAQDEVSPGGSVKMMGGQNYRGGDGSDSMQLVGVKSDPSGQNVIGVQGGKPIIQRRMPPSLASLHGPDAGGY